MSARTMTRELRAFPRFECSIPARLGAADLDEEGQVIDMSRNGCKWLPYSVERLVSRRWMPGDPLTLTLGGRILAGSLVWATPNASALGCQFVATLSEGEMRLIIPGWRAA